ncbi:ABC transporter ATP-binding protein [Mesorhizobium sp.]|uniref:ABC transporter ATP-binding protein n=1 Tax=Mesorhizobium sp. TaxID=1871066 RepID=UPI000FE3B639|nr:ABC transporter ATP-binding protein [Mesorhizobium sp.]RWN57938.1 MAG: ABC transporter ATP-binding protein [Mesorhizobium sp.]RWN78942.1 MAG: ABC transporter ATP-binding protein [Mesorhizobium sp.]RWN84501.1 MAG: ABC transporter ATP-binding protein [Mesorhizobium sp.]RWN92620.1 MAG: ABC transporter ATP-binding protein [Mesorhizobium sp.]RWO17580.1 MAG: ABC transporter ATP-binding protein [Mesorhizobium sp.]
MSVNAPLLVVEGLTVSFRSDAGLVRAVAGVSFAVEQREIVGVVGESGSGKSQTLLAIMGLIDSPNAVVSGSIRFMGQELVGLNRRALDAIRGRQVAMIFQDPMSALTPVHTIGNQIGEQVRAHEKVSARAARARAVQLLDAVGIANPDRVVDGYPHQLSGGMRQRAVIAMALSCNPALLVADEPTTALDVTVQAQILELIGRLRDQFGSAVILVTHDLGVVAQVADRVLVMYGGRFVEEGRKSSVFRTPLHPYTWGLFGSIPPMDGERPVRLAAIPGAPPSLSDLPKGCAFGPRCAFRHDACLVQLPTMRGDGHRAACVLPEARRKQFNIHKAVGVEMQR